MAASFRVTIGKHGDDHDISHMVEAVAVEKHGPRTVVAIRIKPEFAEAEGWTLRHLRALEKMILESVKK